MSPFLHPLIKDGKVARFGLRAAWSLFFGRRGFAFPFHSVQDCSLHALHAIYAGKQVKSWIIERQLNVTGVKTATDGKQPFGYYKHDRGVGLGSEERFEPGHCRIVITSCVFFFYFKRIELLLFLSLTVTSNVITESSEKNRRTVQKSVIFTSKQLFCQSQKRSKKGKPFFPSKCFAKLGLQKGCFTDNWLNGNYLLVFFYLCFLRSSGHELLISQYHCLIELKNRENKRKW